MGRSCSWRVDLGQTLCPEKLLDEEEDAEDEDEFEEEDEEEYEVRFGASCRVFLIALKWGRESDHEGYLQAEEGDGEEEEEVDEGEEGQGEEGDAYEVRKSLPLSFCQLMSMQVGFTTDLCFVAVLLTSAGRLNVL